MIKKTLLIISTGVGFIALGCASHKPHGRSDKIPEYVSTYLAAQDLLRINKKVEGCALLQELTRTPQSLQNLTLLRFELECGQATVGGSSSPLDLKNIPHWYSHLTSEIQQRRGNSKEDLKVLAAGTSWQDKLARLRKQRDFPAAIDLLQKKISEANNEDTKYELYRTLRQVYKTAQNRKAYLETGDFMLETAKKSFQAQPSDLQRARRLNNAYVLNVKAYWTDDYIDRAKSLLDEAQQLLEKKYSLQEIRYLRGSIAKEQKNLELAQSEFKAALAEPQESAEIELRLLWSEAWLLMKLKNPIEARPLFQRYAQLHPDSLEKFRGDFWAAKMLQDSDTNKMQQELKVLAEKDLLGYYGLLAHRELGALIPPAADSYKFADDIENEKDRQLVNEARDLIAVREYTAASKLVNHLQIRINRYVLFNYDAELVFPRLYKNEIAQISKKTGVSSELIYSIIRQESAFDPMARSHADALGLMQLLPSIAVLTAKENKIPFKDDFDLYKPEINIELGAFELKKLLQQYNQQFILAVARYNASENAIDGWLKQRYSTNPIEFIEDIGYDETRNYVKLVMRNHISYQRLQAQSPFAFPENLLKWNIPPGKTH